MEHPAWRGRDWFGARNCPDVSTIRPVGTDSAREIVQEPAQEAFALIDLVELDVLVQAGAPVPWSPDGR